MRAASSTTSSEGDSMSIFPFPLALPAAILLAAGLKLAGLLS
jgi:hypothetical protein